MANYTFEFIDSTTQEKNENALSGVLESPIGSGVKNEKKTSKEGKTFQSEFNQKIEKGSIAQYIISPLNTVTGGLASPVYQSIRKMARGQTFGAVAGDLVATGILLAVSTGLNALQKRMEEVEAKVNEMGNNDNALIRAGSVSKATYYSGNIFGIKSKTDRS